MTKKIKIADLPDFDPAEHLDSEEAIAGYLIAILEENDPVLLRAALGDIARAYGMMKIAKTSGVSREALNRALAPNAPAQPDLLTRISRALSGPLTAHTA